MPWPSNHCEKVSAGSGAEPTPFQKFDFEWDDSELPEPGPIGRRFHSTSHSRIAAFKTFPASFGGNASHSATVSGTVNRATPLWASKPASAATSGIVPSRGTITATARSPVLASGTPTMAISAMSG